MPNATLEALHERHLERSRQAVAPEALPLALSKRLPKKSGLTVVHHGRDAITRYHRRRRAERGDEAISPGEAGRIARLRCVEFVRKRRSIWNPKTRTHESVEHSFQLRFNQVTMSPKWVTFSTSFDATEKAILHVLYGLASRDDLTRTGQLVVRGVTADLLAQYSGVSLSTFYRRIRSLAAKSAVRVRRMGLNKPNVYWLATSENGSWTYPRGSNQSARARAQRALCQKDIAKIDWNEFCQAPAADRAPLPRRAIIEVPKNKPAPPVAPSPLSHVLGGFFDAARSERLFQDPAPDRSNELPPFNVKSISSSVSPPDGRRADDRPPGRSTD